MKTLRKYHGNSSYPANDDNVFINNVVRSDTNYIIYKIVTD